MEFRTIQSSEIDNDAIAARVAQLQYPADDAGFVAAGVALCWAVEQAGGDRMEIEIGCAGSVAELSGGWRVTVMRADDVVSPGDADESDNELNMGLNLALLVARMAAALKKNDPDNQLAATALNYLERIGSMSPMRDASHG